MTRSTNAVGDVPYVCPRCRAPLARAADMLSCTGCPHTYPIVLGIPDLRVFPDPWISFEGDREKARRLADLARDLSLEATVRAYWSLTPGTPKPQAERFVRYVVSAESRARDWLAQVNAAEGTTSGPWLEIGTGTGDLVVAGAERGTTIVGADIALQWLVVAARRAQLAGVRHQLVCCHRELGAARQLAEHHRHAEEGRGRGFLEVILYFNVGLKPHAMVKEEMDRFMREVAPNFSGKHIERRKAA